jgi:hypothetical protein
MKVYAKFHQPPQTPYWSLAMSNGGAYIACQLHWDKPTEEKEFPSMEDFLEWAGENNLKLPWQQ